MLRNPGPATSTFSTSGEGGSASAIACATSRGGRPGPLGQRERHVGGEIPVTFLLGSQQLGRGQVALDAQHGGRLAHALLEPVDELRFDHEGFPRPIAVCTALTSSSGSNGFVT